MRNLEIKKVKKEEKKLTLTYFKKDSNLLYVIVFNRLSPGQSQDRLWLLHYFGWVTNFLVIVVSLLLSLIPENLERRHSTPKTANDTPKKCSQERIFEGNHISCPVNSALQDWRNEFSSVLKFDMYRCCILSFGSKLLPARDWALG